MNRKRLVAILFSVALLATALLLFAFIRTRPSADAPPGQLRPFAGWLSATAEAASPFSLTPVTLAPQPYQHPSGAFSVRYPEGWQIDETEDATLFTAPDDSASFGVNFGAADSQVGGGFAAGAASEFRAAWADLPGFTLQPDSVSLSNYWSVGFGYDQPATPDHPALPMTGLVIVQLRDGVTYRQIFTVRNELQTQFAVVFQTILESLALESHAALPNSE
ncbi:MAG: hypothetical protein HYZ49_18995 [Chloroflexi bacterium]|nr:hypothetical protein [Chloroflexota bacterium]